MCNIASQTWMMAASAFIRTSDREDLGGPDDVKEVNQENNQNNQMVLVGDKSSLPLVIPNQQHCPQHLVVSASGCTSGPTSPTTASPEMEKGSYSYCAMSYDTIPMNSQASSMSSSTSGSDEMAISGSGDVDNLTIYSMAEVRKHRDVSDGWMVIYDKVYDVTDFLDEVRIKYIYFLLFLKLYFPAIIIAISWKFREIAKSLNYFSNYSILEEHM